MRPPSSAIRSFPMQWRYNAQEAKSTYSYEQLSTLTLLSMRHPTPILWHHKQAHISVIYLEANTGLHKPGSRTFQHTLIPAYINCMVAKTSPPSTFHIMQVWSSLAEASFLPTNGSNETEFIDFLWPLKVWKNNFIANQTLQTLLFFFITYKLKMICHFAAIQTSIIVYSHI